ncbi:MAG: PEP-CTERM sorting domain-containing protein [Planctomycetota bacterium]|jgi:hypothetical protein
MSTVNGISLNNTTGSFTVSGTAVSHSDGGLIQNTGGTVNINSASQVTGLDIENIGGAITIQSSTVDRGAANNGIILNSNGMMDINDSEINVNVINEPGATLNIADSTITHIDNHGLLRPDIYRVQATVMTVTETYQQYPNASLEIGFVNPIPGGLQTPHISGITDPAPIPDRLFVAAANLAGNFTVTPNPLLDPAYGTTFDIISPIVAPPSTLTTGLEPPETILFGGSTFDSYTGLLLNPDKILVPLYSPDAFSLLTAIPGDFDLSGAVGVPDLIAWAQNFGASDAAFQLGDANLDGLVGVPDLIVWAQNFGKSTADSISSLGTISSATAIPEPSTLAVVCVVTMGGGLYRRRRGR